jgi:hypothetical protein
MHLRFTRAVGAALVMCLVTLSACADQSTPMEITRVPVDGRAKFSTGDVITVTTTQDVVTGSLRAAVAQTTGGETIRFDPSIAGAKITLDTTIDIQNFVTIEGPADKGIVISGGNKFEIFHIHNGATFRNVTLTEGQEVFTASEDVPAGAVFGKGPLLLDHSTVSGNNIFLQAISGTDITLVNSTVANNPGSRGAVGILTSPTGSLVLFNSTVAFNSGGGIRGTDNVTFHNAIVAENGPDGNLNCLTVGPGFKFLGKSITNDTFCGGGVLEVLVADPKLLPLADNGGPTQTLALSPDSPAIDATDCDLAVDQRYVPRDVRCDIGAFEFQFTKVAITIEQNASVDPKTGAATVSGTVTCDPREESFNLAINVKQDQRLRRVSGTVEGSTTVPVLCGKTSTPWIALVTAPTGFVNSTATVSVQTANTAEGVRPSATSSDVQLFWTRR